MTLSLRTALSLLLLSFSMASFPSETKITVAFTTDVHGNFFPYDFITLAPGEGSLARVSTAVDSLRAANPGGVILLDNGDILQGQPTVYYYNFIDTVSPHIVPEIFDFMEYDAATIGNHDVETGHAVYDRVHKAMNIPWLGANVIDTLTGEPYLTPYTVIERKGKKIAVLGLLTPAIPSWLPENLWSGLRFDDMAATARKWIPIIREREHPDAIIGLFHSGHDASKTTGSVIENASMKVAAEVDGFDLVLMGHDHQRFLSEVVSPSGKKVPVVNPANNARSIGVIDFVFHDTPSGKDSLSVVPKLLDVTAVSPSKSYLARFADRLSSVSDFVERQLGTVTDTLSTRDAFFGPSAFMTLLHDLQLEISGAQISFAAPLSFDASIVAGPLRVSDMFTLYKYENMLYTLKLTGREIKDYLEMAYDLWTAPVSDSEDSQLIRFASENPSLADNRLKNPSYNFDSAAGIDYTVDITRPRGEKITITSLSDGTPFNPDSTYTVAVNSYRANGGGDLLTLGAGIPADELSSRVVRATDKDLRYYLIKAVEKRGVISPRVETNWRFVPEKLASEAGRRSRHLLFGAGASRNQK